MTDMFSAEYRRDPFTEIQQLSSTRTRPLKRNSSDFDDFTTSPTHGPNNGGPTKSRRVDPERLACRLDSELVAEMEVLIAQGTRMPPFEIRKVLQERYNVDRRHIYDYFHSRGMRVAREDKHRNLSRRRAMLNKARAHQSTSETSLPRPTHATSDAQNSNVSSSTLDLAAAFEPSQKLAAHASQGGKYRAAPIDKIAKPRKQKRAPKPSMSRPALPIVVPPSPIVQPVFSPVLAPDIEDNVDAPQPIAEIETTESRKEEQETLDDAEWDFLSSTYLQDSCFDSVSTLPEFGAPVYEPILEEAIASPHSDRLSMYNFLNDHIGYDSYALERAGSYQSLMEDRSLQHYSCLSPRKLPNVPTSCEQPPVPTSVSGAVGPNGLLGASASSLSGLSSPDDLTPPVDQHLDLFLSLPPIEDPFATDAKSSAIQKELPKLDDLKLPHLASLVDTLQQALTYSATPVAPCMSLFEGIHALLPKDEGSSRPAPTQPTLSLPLTTYMLTKLQSSAHNVTSIGGPSVPSSMDSTRASRTLPSDMRPIRRRTASAGGGL